MDKTEAELTELERERLEILRREVMIGLDDVANGRLSDRTVEEIAAHVAETNDRPTHPSTGSG